MDKLKPCPFCGGEAKLDIDPKRYGKGDKIYCIECGVSMPMHRTEVDYEVVDRWNDLMKAEDTAKQIEGETENLLKQYCQRNAVLIEENKAIERRLREVEKHNRQLMQQFSDEVYKKERAVAEATIQFEGKLDMILMWTEEKRRADRAGAEVENA